MPHLDHVYRQLDQCDPRVASADYVEKTTITDVPCDHLAVRLANGVDFQVWIAQGDQPLPRRIVITYNDDQVPDILKC